MDKFCYLVKHLSLISVMTCLALLSDATEFDPEKKRVSKETLILWDYGRAGSSPDIIKPLSKDEIETLATGPWTAIGMPRRFITESQWKLYEKYAANAGINLMPKFVMAGKKRFKSASNHFIKLKELIKGQLAESEPLVFSESGEALQSIKDLNADSLIHISLFKKYLEETNLIGDAPAQYEIRGYKMAYQEKTILKIIDFLNLDPTNLPRKLAHSPISLKLTIRSHALEDFDLFPTKAVFNQTWLRLTRKGMVRYDDSVGIG